MNRDENVVVLMSTYNGSCYLKEQIDSILHQSVNLQLYIRDDGSSDQTIKIIETYKNSNRVFCEQGKNLGAKKSFMELIINSSESEYYALSDQDDVWDIDKLEAAINKIKEAENGRGEMPVIYHSAVKLVDATGTVIGGKGGAYIYRGFLQGDTRSVTGCTLVFNKSMRNLLKKHFPKSFTMHDVWIHAVCLAVGGTVLYDPIAHIKYRQHANNVVGGKKDFWSRVRRKIKYYRNLDDKQFSRMYREILENYRMFMPDENIKRCEKLCSYADSWKNTLEMLKDSEFFKGRLSWRLEKKILMLLRRY